MAAQNQGLQDLNASIASLTGVATSAVAFIKGLQTQIATLIAQEGEVTDAQLETLAQSANAAIAEITTAITPSTPAPAAS